MAYKNALELAAAFDELSPQHEEEIRKQMADLRDRMKPYDDARDQEIIRKINAGDKSDTPYPEEYNELYNQHKGLRDKLYAIYGGRYDKIAQQLGRKRYENFKPYPNSIPIDKNNPGGSPDVVGADRIYALYQHAKTNNLDFGRVLADDRSYFPDRTPNTLEFGDTRFDLNSGRSGGNQWRRIKEGENPDPRFGEVKDGWRHISTGTNYGDDIGRLLEKENLKIGG